VRRDWLQMMLDTLDMLPAHLLELRTRMARPTLTEVHDSKLHPTVKRRPTDPAHSQDISSSRRINAKTDFPLPLQHRPIKHTRLPSHIRQPIVRAMHQQQLWDLCTVHPLM
jgi:hypothetical protein